MPTKNLLLLLALGRRGRLRRRLRRTAAAAAAAGARRRSLARAVHVGQTALAAVLAIEVARHEDTRAELRVRADTPQARDLAVAVDLVVLEHGQLDLLVLVLDLLGLGVLLLLALLAAAAQAQHEVQRALLLNVVVRERAAILKLLARKDQALLVRRDALLVLDLGLDVLNRVRRLHLQGDGLSRQCLYENLRPTARLGGQPPVRRSRIRKGPTRA